MALSPNKIIALMLGGAVAGIAIRAAVLIYEPPVSDPLPLLRPALEAAPSAMIPDECRSAVSAPPECTTAWGAHRAHFFGQKLEPAAKVGLHEGEQP